jgi:hypothetical protein
MIEAAPKNPETEKAWAQARIEEATSKERVAVYGAKMFTIRTLSAYGTFEGETVWDGVVDVFTINGHPKARKAYAFLPYSQSWPPR